MTRFLVSLCFAFPVFASASWSLNVGHHNPPGSNIGVNFMYLWTKWAFEAGIGNVESNSSGTSVGGAVNMKYLFSQGPFRPYLQFGAGSAIGIQTSSSTTAGAAVGGGYFGGGIFLVGAPFYVYASYNAGNSGFFQGGIGYDF